jgi:hypothetical protein
MMVLPASLRGCVVGRSGSGKTVWMWRRWLARAPRALIVDQTGEWRALEPNARFAFGLTDTIRALHEVAHRHAWRIVATLSNEELYALIDLLIPIPNIAASPAIKLGGFVLYLDEVDLVIPTVAPESARSINRRSRHAGLSVLSATHRISNVSKELTSMCDFVAVMAVHEPACMDYLESLMGREKMRAAITWAQQPFHVAVYRPAQGALVFLPPEPIGSPT